LRWNQISRLREAFRKAIADVREQRIPLPMIVMALDQTREIDVIGIDKSYRRVYLTCPVFSFYGGIFYLL
jgi:hypothetical protein